MKDLGSPHLHDQLRAISKRQGEKSPELKEVYQVALTYILGRLDTILKQTYSFNIHNGTIRNVTMSGEAHRKRILFLLPFPMAMMTTSPGKYQIVNGPEIIF